MKSAAAALLFVLVLLPIGLPAQTITNPRSPAEFEEVQGVVIRWDEKEYYQIFTNVQSAGWTSYWTGRYNGTMNTQATIVREALNEGIDVYVCDDTSHTGKYGPYLYSDYHVADTLAMLGIAPQSRLHIIPYPALDDAIEKVWIRDWGQYGIYKNGVDTMRIVGRALDTTIGKFLGKQFITTSVMDGGNFLTDGHGRLICDQFQTNIDQTLFGINDLITVANYKIHVDYYMKLLNEETFIVDSVPWSNHNPSLDTFYGDSAALEGAINTMKARTTCFGRQYRFIRVQNAPTYNQGGVTYFTSDAGYSNSLILNRTVLVPTYDSPPTDTAALRAYRRAMPGYRVIGIPAKYYAARQGAIHCITKELPADNPLFIAHPWLPDTLPSGAPGYGVRAYMKTPSGVSHAEVHWSINPPGGFQTAAMTQVAADTFAATIPGQADGSTISYYITAGSVNGKEVVRPVVAPAAYYVAHVPGTPPSCQINCPANVAAGNAPGQCGAIVNYSAPTLTGTCGAVTSTPASGSFFPIGVTTVVCTTAAGPACSFTVTVADTEHPSISCPANIVAPENPPGSGSAAVTYAAPAASDNCTGLAVTSLPASGSLFPTGVTTVHCTAVDSAGNRDSCSFTVTVVDTSATVAGYPYNADWNLVSLPLLTPDPRKSTLFPGASSALFAYGGTYTIAESLQAGRAYWLKFPAAGSVVLSGTKFFADTVDVSAGWNLIGGLSQAVALTAIATVPPGLSASNLFAYEGHYVVADSLKPSQGYWLKMSAPGQLILSASGPKAGRLVIVPGTELPPAAPDAPRAPETPKAFALVPNFPNPFNPSTTLSFDLPEPSHVLLQVWSPLGALVATLVDADRGAGRYTAAWNAAGMPSGVYFARFTAGRYTRTSPMLLVR